MGHKIPLENFDEFERDDQADGDESAVQNEIGAKGDSCESDALRGIGDQIAFKCIGLTASVVAIACTDKAADDLEGKNYKDVEVYFWLDVADFGKGVASVHHNGCVLACIHNYPNDPFSIFEFAAAQDHILFVNSLAKGWLIVLQFDFPLEGLYLSRRVDAPDLPTETGKSKLVIQIEEFLE